MNADDFGLTAGVNRAIVELHQAGVLTSTTLMAKAAATDEAIELARANPSLGRGLPRRACGWRAGAAAARRFPRSLTRNTGCFPPKLTTFLMRLFTGRIRTAEIEAEAAAQIALLKKPGLRLTHIDTHKHTHMFPPVLRPVLRAARAAGIRAVRNPFEPEWAVARRRGLRWCAPAEVMALRRLGPFFRTADCAEERFDRRTERSPWRRPGCW